MAGLVLIVAGSFLAAERLPWQARHVPVAADDLAGRGAGRAPRGLSA